MSSEQLALYKAYTDGDWSPCLTGQEPSWNTEQDDDNPFWDMMDRL